MRLEKKSDAKKIHMQWSETSKKKNAVVVIKEVTRCFQQTRAV